MVLTMNLIINRECFCTIAYLLLGAVLLTKLDKMAKMSEDEIKYTNECYEKLGFKLDEDNINANPGLLLSQSYFRILFGVNLERILDKQLQNLYA